MESGNIICAILSTAACVAILSFGGCQATINYQNNTAMVEMVSKGADAMDAKCAVNDAGSYMCAIRAASKNK